MQRKRKGRVSAKNAGQAERERERDESAPHLDIEPLVQDSHDVVVLVVVQEPGEEVEALLADADARPRVPKLAGHGIVVDVLLAPQLPELLELLGPSRGREILHKGAVRVEELLEVGRLLQVDQVQKTVDENGVQEALQVLLGRRDRIKSGAAREAREANVVQHSWGMEDGPRGTRDRSEMGGVACPLALTL